MSVYLDPTEWTAKHEHRLALLDRALVAVKPQSENDELRLEIGRLKTQIRNLKRDRRKLQAILKLTRAYFQAPPGVAAGLIDNLLGKLF